MELEWEEFKLIFLEEFIFDTAQERMRELFAQLEQVDSTVADYVKKSTTLARFALDLVAVESRKVKRFIFGLRPVIRCLIPDRGDMTLSEVIEAAKRQEYYKEDEVKKLQVSGSQSTGGPPRDSGRDGQGDNQSCSFQGNRNRGQNCSAWSGPSGNFSRKRDRDTYSQGSVSQPPHGSATTGGGSGAPSGDRGCWKCGQSGHRQSECRAVQCFDCKGFRASKIR